MGYDLHIENPRGALLPALARKQALREAYLAERDRALEVRRTFLGRDYKPEEHDWYVEQAPAVSAAFDKYMEADDPSYFHANIFSMGMYRTYMFRLGMMVNDPGPQYDRTDPEAQAKWAIAVEGDSGTGLLPSYKFGSNDGWFVNPDEIAGALAAFDTVTATQRDEVIPSGDRRYFGQWVAFLRRAVRDGDGIRVF
jgi:hypothetical protein